MTDCEHTWRLQEEGYVRTWQIEMDEETQTVTAYFGGTEDFSEDGDGELRLECSTCLITKPLPDDWEVDYR